MADWRQKNVTNGVSCSLGFASGCVVFSPLTIKYAQPLIITREEPYEGTEIHVNLIFEIFVHLFSVFFLCATELYSGLLDSLSISTKYCMPARLLFVVKMCAANLTYSVFSV